MGRTKMKSIKEWTLGYSRTGNPIEAIQVGNAGEVIHFYGGVHGDEPEGVSLAMRLKEYVTQHVSEFKDKTIIIVPIVNPDGYKNRTRVNANLCDLNRNLPSRDWKSSADQPRYYPGLAPASEPETQAIVDLIEQTRPKKIISFHSLTSNQINYDGPAQKLAQAMARHNLYPVTDDIGYPTAGSLGSYAGRDKNIAVITYELLEKISPDDAWSEALKALLEAIHFKL